MIRDHTCSSGSRLGLSPRPLCPLSRLALALVASLVTSLPAVGPSAPVAHAISHAPHPIVRSVPGAHSQPVLLAARLSSPRPIARATTFTWTVSRLPVGTRTIDFTGCWTAGPVGRTLRVTRARVGEHRPRALGVLFDRSGKRLIVRDPKGHTLPVPLTVSATFARTYRSTGRGTVVRLVASGRRTVGVTLGGPSCVLPGPPHMLRHEVPKIVANRDAMPIGPHNSTALIEFNVELSNPTPEQGVAAIDWFISQGMRVTFVDTDYSFISLLATTRQMDQAFHTTILDYHSAHRASYQRSIFYSIRTDPSVPSGLGIAFVDNLDNVLLLRHRTLYQRIGYPVHETANICSYRACYTPADFRAAYDVARVGDGRGMTIGIIQSSPKISQSDFNLFQRGIRAHRDRLTLLPTS